MESLTNGAARSRPTCLPVNLRIWISQAMMLVWTLGPMMTQEWTSGPMMTQGRTFGLMMMQEQMLGLMMMQGRTLGLVILIWCRKMRFDCLCMVKAPFCICAV